MVYSCVVKWVFTVALVLTEVASAQTSLVYQEAQLTVSNVAVSNAYSVSLTRNPGYPILWHLSTNSGVSRVEIRASGVVTASVPDGWVLSPYDGSVLIYAPTGTSVIINTNPVTFSYVSQYRYTTPYTNLHPLADRPMSWIIGGGIHETNLNGRPSGAGYQRFATLGPVVPRIASLEYRDGTTQLFIADAYPENAILESLVSNEWIAVTNWAAGAAVSNVTIDPPNDERAIYRFRFVQP